MSDQSRPGYIHALAHLRTPDAAPWTDRRHIKTPDDDPRPAFERDRDRIIHSEHFRRLQHKTQVLIVTEGDLYSTRLMHSVETAQVGRSLACSFGLNAPLAEAICLGHDVGHTPFGHQGEETLKRLLKGHDRWESNHHSLLVLDEIEVQYPAHLGLDLTMAVREGIARHKTAYDDPAVGYGSGSELGAHKSPSLEAQIGNVADEVAYVSHDVHDALEHGLVTRDELGDALSEVSLWRRASVKTDAEIKSIHPEGWKGVDEWKLTVRWLHRNLISILLDDVLTESARRGAGHADLLAARDDPTPVIAFSDEMRPQLDRVRGYLHERVYKGPLVARQNAKADHVLERLFETLCAKRLLLPWHVQQRINGSENATVIAKNVALFLASLTDRAAIDLYGELFIPSDRAMGHHVH
jgi:dGTPase